MKTKKNTHTLSLPFANPAKALHTSLPLEEYAIRVLVLSVAAIVIFYIVFVSMSVVNVIASKEASDNVLALRATVSELESEYFELSGTVTAESGGHLGLAPVQKTNYVSRAGAVGAAKRTRNDL